MTQGYLNRHGVRYYLPDFGPPVRWVATIWGGNGTEVPTTLLYHECDAENLCCRSIEVAPDGRVTLAYPGGLDGDQLPEGPLPSLEEMNASSETMSREMTGDEFNALWTVFSRFAEKDATK